MVSISDQLSELSTPAKVLVIVGGVGILLIGLVIAAVISAAVVATFVLELGGSSSVGSDPSKQSPGVAFEFDFDDEAHDLHVTHAGGDSFSNDSVHIEMNNTTTTWSTETVTAGDSTVVSNVDTGDTVRVVWIAHDGTSTTLSQYTIP